MEFNFSKDGNLVLIVLLVLCGSVWCYIKFILKNEKRKFKKIDFSKKEEYLFISYLGGSAPLENTKGVVTKSKTTYLIETENRERIVKSFSFQVKEVDIIQISEKQENGFFKRMRNHLFDPDASNASENSLYFNSSDQNKIYEITILLKNNIEMRFESKKVPYNFFEQVMFSKDNRNIYELIKERRKEEKYGITD